MKILTSICMLGLLMSSLMLTSCGSSDNSGKTPKVSVKNTSWILYQLNGNTLKSENDVTLNFSGSDNKVSGSAPCNNYTGTFNSSSGNLTFGPLASTKRMCPEMESETVFLNALQNTSSFKISGSELNLFDSGGKLLMIFKKK